MTIASEQAVIERLAEFLAVHALLLFGIGLVLSALAILAIVASVRWLSAVLELLRRMLSQHPSLSARLTGLSVPPRARTVAAGVLVYLIVGLVSAAAIAVFVAVAEEVVVGGEMAVFDVAFGQALRKAGNPQWQEFFARVSRLGNPDVVFGATVAGAVALVVRGQLATASVWLASQAGAAVLVIVLKALFARSRPDFMDSAAETSWSFPSGHAMATLVLVAMACSVLLRYVTSGTVAGILVMLSATWTLVMAFSRLYLGVHFASDVVAGLFAGLAWVCVCVAALYAVAKIPPPVASTHRHLEDLKF
jgi:undecaprenyl-diphosphatase